MTNELQREPDQAQLWPVILGAGGITFILIMLIGFVGHMYFVKSMTRSRLEHIPKAKKVKIKKKKNKKGKKGKKDKKSKTEKTEKEKGKKAKKSKK